MKTKRLLAFLLIAVLVIGVMPLTVAASYNPPKYSYKIYVKYVNTDNNQQVGQTKLYDSGDLYKQGHKWPTKDVTVNGADPEFLPFGYEIVGSTTQTATVSKPSNKDTFEETKTFKVKKAKYDYSVSVRYLNGTEVVGGPTVVKSGTKNILDSAFDVWVTPTAPAGYDLVSSANKKVTVSYQNANITVDFQVTEQAPETYNYSVSVKYVLQGTDTVVGGGPTLVESGPLNVGDTKEVTVVPTAPAGYDLVPDTESETVTITEEDAHQTVTFFVTEEEGEPTPNPESPTPLYIPPQVIVPTTPTPEPEIELPEEEIPAEVPEIEEEEQFEDEEIPTDVPTTGDASPVFPAIALLALAGAAFALTFKKSRNNG